MTEQTEETLAIAARAVELVAECDARELEGPALALLAQAHGMRGEEGDSTALSRSGTVRWTRGSPGPGYPTSRGTTTWQANAYY